PHAHAHATAVVAPPVPPLKPVPIIATKVAGTGAQNAQGAALAGSGSGAGGEGQGTGSGGAGNGDGDGGDGAELISGQIRNSDIPQSLRSAPFSGITRTTIAVDATGRVTGCRIVRSSGNGMLDGLTCRLIFQRFRFHPARDDQGRAQPDTFDYDQEWTITGQFGDLRQDQ
ncbi:MAG: energy transducer TonB, partial [Pseudomonadota bacterium]|nr:energy transducer TonB [Pseudomonadota bacterium]